MEKFSKIINTMFESDIIYAEDYKCLIKGIDIINLANKKAENIITKANEIYSQQKDQGYKDGQNDFQNEYIEKSIDLTIAILDNLKQFEKQITNVVTYCVKKIVDDYIPDKVLISMIKKSIKYIHNQKKIILKMSEEQINKIQDKIKEINQSFPDSIISTVIDNSIAMGDCVIHAEFCTIRTGINLYLSLLEKKVNEKFMISKNNE